MNQSRADGFNTTNWSLVLAAVDDAPARARDAMERLCSRYWFPVYAFVRRLGNDVHQSEDLTQGFFEFAIEHQLVERARKDKGRFRNFILSSLNNTSTTTTTTTPPPNAAAGRIVPLDETEAEFLASESPIRHRRFVRPPLGRHAHPAGDGKSPRRISPGAAGWPPMMRCCPISLANLQPAIMSASRLVSRWKSARSEWRCTVSATVSANCCAAKSPTR
jgi:hypothetical protein